MRYSMRVTQDPSMTIQNDRPSAIKTLRITVEESIAHPTSVTFSGEQP